MSGADANGSAGDSAMQAVREVLAARAARLKARLASKSEEATLWVAQFRVGDRQYAIPLSDFRAAVPLKLVTPVPLSPPQVVGILRYQGQVISALSLASLLGVRGWHVDPTVLLVVEAKTGKLVAFDCEEIPKACSVSVAAVDKARRAADGPVAELFVAGAATVHLLDLALVLERGGWTRHGH